MSLACNINVPYSANDGIGSRFINHFVLGVKQDIGSHKKNVLEKMGDVGLWMIEKFPGKVWNVMKNPKVVTLALTALAILSASFVFYPTATYLAVKAAIALVPTIPLWTVRFAAYIATVGIIISTATRAEGRFINTELMEDFYKNEKA